MVIEEKKKPEELIDFENAVETGMEDEGLSELVIDVRRMLNEYDIIRIVLPDSPGERMTTDRGTELVFFQEEPVS